MCRHFTTVQLHETDDGNVTVYWREYCIAERHETPMATYDRCTHAEALDVVDGLMTSWWERQKAVYGAEATA